MTKKKDKRFNSSLGSTGFLFDIEADMWADDRIPDTRRTVSLTMYGEDMTLGVASGDTKDPKKLREFAEWLMEAADFLEGKD